MTPQSPFTVDPLLGIGFYTSGEAARLLNLPVRSINRWLGGYTHGTGAARIHHPPLWQPQLPMADGRIELGFKDVIELRFVAAFKRQGLSLRVIRRCLMMARDIIRQDHPFSTQRFKTDGRTIFLQSLGGMQDERIVDLGTNQYVFSTVIEQTFKDLDIEDDAVRRWRPYKGKPSIVVDPLRAFGQPIAAIAGIPTIALADAVRAEGSIGRVARLYEVRANIVADAVAFEESLKAA